MQSLTEETSYVMGDFNINLHKSSHYGFYEYQETFLSSNFSPLISIAAHQKLGCKNTCIDNIHTNNHENVLLSGTLSESNSHHLAVFQFSKILYDSDDRKNKLIQHYNFCRSNLENFTAKLSEVTRNFSTNEHDFNTFNELFMAIMNSTCKLTKPKTTKRNNINNPLITDGLIHSIVTKHNLYKNWKRTVSIACPEGNVEKREKYGTYNKHLKKLIKHAKYSFYSKKITNCNGNMKKTSRIINDIRGKHKKDIKPLFNSGNSKITDRKEIAKKFNEYYASLAEKMNSSVMHDVSTDEVPPFESYMSKPKENSMYLSDGTDDEIYFIIKDLVDGKSSDIPIKLIKNCAPVITPLLKKYFNNFMQTGEFPDSLKVGKITSVFKKSNQEEFENYRPISTFLEKFLKKLFMLFYMNTSQQMDFFMKINLALESHILVAMP